MSLKAVGWLLVLGPGIFWTGAVTPPYRQWMGVPIQEYLTIVGANARNWQVMHTLFAVGMLLTTIGLAGLGGHLRSSLGGGAWACVAVALFTSSSVLWLVQVAFRVSVTAWASAELSVHGTIPTAYPALHRSAGILFALHLVLGYLSEAAFGVALLKSSPLPRGVGWTALTFGLMALPGLATPLFRPPLMLQIVPFVMGIAVLRQR